MRRHKPCTTSRSHTRVPYHARINPNPRICTPQVGSDGALCCTIADDKSAKIYDVVNFDMMAMLRLPYVPGAVAWLYRPEAAVARLAISEKESPRIHIYDAKSGSSDPIHTFEVCHNPSLLIVAQSSVDCQVNHRPEDLGPISFSAFGLGVDPIFRVFPQLFMSCFHKFEKGVMVIITQDLRKVLVL